MAFDKQTADAAPKTSIRPARSPLVRGRLDPLADLLEKTALSAKEAGLTVEELDAELAAYNDERRS